jgi:hypothetical protein
MVILLLFVFQIVTGSPVCSVDRTAGSSTLNTVSTTGVESLVTILPEPIQNPAISIDSTGNTAYVGSLNRVLQYDLTSGKQLANITLPTGGETYHTAWDGVYKRLFGIWISNQDKISIIEMTGGVVKTLLTLPAAGRVMNAYYGVTVHHYMVIIRYDDDTTPNSITFYNMATTPPSVYESNPLNVNVQSVAIDYMNHNVWVVAQNPTGGFDFGIMHMNGTMQQVMSTTNAYVRAGSAATVDINTQYYYTELYTPSGPFFAQYRLSNGMLTATATKYDQQAIGYAVV